MRIKGITINKQSQNLTIAIDELMRSLFKLLFWAGMVSLVPGWIAIFEYIKPYLEAMP
jgi:hypothetical protein